MRCCARPDGRLLGDMFDGAGFVRGVQRKGCELDGARALVVGCGGVGSAIAASLAGGGRRRASACSTRTPAAAEALAERLRTHYPKLEVTTGSNDPAGYDSRRQRDAARHERRRPAADGRDAHRARRPSSARS